MNETTAARPLTLPQPLLSVPLHLVVAVVIATVLGFAWRTAAQASHVTVQTVAQNLSRAYIKLPSVEIVGRREGSTKATRPAG